MKLTRIRSRSAGLLAAATAAAALAGAQAAGAATTTTYTTAGYLQRELGLPASADPAIEPVTFDRFQWLLRQDARLAILIGDPATDPTFRDRAQDTEAAAKAAGVGTVYWFNPNLSGNARVGDITEPNLDIRKPSGITSLADASRTTYGKAWLALVGRSLGNGLKITVNQPDTKNSTVDVADDTAVVHDAGGTEVDGRPGALYDYSGGAASAPAEVQDSYFLVYDKAGASGAAEARIRAWTNLSNQPGTTAAREDVTKALAADSGAKTASVDEFTWWKHEANAKHLAGTSQVGQGRDVPVLRDEDGKDWRINQITYPQLVDLLEHVGPDERAALLFGGTWCPNTRPVVPATNAHAAKRGVTVFNFDTVLDGGLVGGNTTSAANPLQTRNTQDYTPRGGTTTVRANPSFLYGDVVNTYLKNIKTEYGADVTYSPGGRNGVPVATAKKLQVPFVLGYGGSAAGDGVKRQWIIDNGDGSYREYMSQWYLTNPQPNQLGLATTIPLDAPIWSTINTQVANVSWRTTPASLYPNTATETDDAQYLVPADTAKLTYAPATGTPTSVSVSSGTGVAIGPDALSSALNALGAAAPTSAATAKTALLGAWGVPTDPNTVLGGIAAVHAIDVFFSGIPDGVASRRTVTAETVTAGTAPKVTVAIDTDYGVPPKGTVSVVVSKDGAPVGSASAPVSGGTATVTLPVLAAGTYDYAATYTGDEQIAAFTEHGRLTVTPAPTQQDPPVAPGSPIPGPPSAPVPGPAPSPAPVRPAPAPSATVKTVKGAVVTAPTHRKGGRYRVTVSVPKGAAAATGKVTVRLKKGAVTKTLTGRLSRGVVTVKVPKLAKGTWKVTITWPGDARYAPITKAAGAIKVTK